ncbi:serine hydrolase domain-containing protein [Symbioplanes lichenis]|uniref:serine hydrolase domain-containing protein n=1 Tax=Symbioplanes lichenis TaxID=1629072 RepID=UPI002739DFDA|nr:serine hydrolase domain-containing protein [Actinoplanes lichenis]
MLDLAEVPGLMDAYQVPGVSVAVGDLSGHVWTAGYGITGGAAPAAVDAGTVFAACSISKHVAAFGALLLVQDGVLELDGDVGDYVTSWRLVDGEGRRARVTVRQLLAHTAGLTPGWYRGYPADRVPSLVEVLEGSGHATTPPVRSALLPGSRFRYAGSHYSVLQQVMVEATGLPFEEFMRERVLTPLGMADSSFDQGFPHRRGQPAARGHHGVGTEVPGGWRVQPELAAAGLWSTPSDLLRLDLEIARAATGDSPLLGRELAVEMSRPQLPGSGYGLGVQAGDGRLGHTGQNVGYTCFSYVWPGSGTAVAAMTNSEDGWELLATIREAADRRYAARVDEVPAAGRYLLRDDYPVDVAVTGGQVTVAAAGQAPVVLRAQPDGSYLYPGLDLGVRFPRPGVLELRQEGVTQTAERATD